MTKQLSNEKLETVTVLLTDVALAIIKAREDGKLDLSDIQHFFPLLGQVLPGVQALSGIGEELTNITVSDVLELSLVVISRLDKVVSEKTVLIVKQSLVAAVESAKLISLIRS